MAKKRRNGTAEATEQPPPEQKARAVTGQKKLRSLLNTARSVKKDISELAGGYGTEIKDAVENHHLHRKAFNVCRSADGMEPGKLAEFLDCLDHYLDISGLRARADKVIRMDFEADGEDADDGENAEPQESTVRAFPAPRGVAAE